MAGAHPDLLVTNATALALTGAVALGCVSVGRAPRLLTRAATALARRAAAGKKRVLLGVPAAVHVSGLISFIVTYYVLADNMGYDNAVGYLHAAAVAGKAIAWAVARNSGPGTVPTKAADDGGDVDEEGAPGRRAQRCARCRGPRPLRAVHVRIPLLGLDNCVPRFDHVSPWLGQAVGAENHRSAAAFLFFWCVESITTVILCTCGAEAVWRHTTYNIPAEFTFQYVPIVSVLLFNMVVAILAVGLALEELRNARANLTRWEVSHPEEAWWTGGVTHENGGAAGPPRAGKNAFDLGSPSANVREFLGLNPSGARDWTTHFVYTAESRTGLSDADARAAEASRTAKKVAASAVTAPEVVAPRRVPIWLRWAPYDWQQWCSQSKFRLTWVFALHAFFAWWTLGPAQWDATGTMFEATLALTGVAVATHRAHVVANWACARLAAAGVVGVGDDKTANHMRVPVLAAMLVSLSLLRESVEEPGWTKGILAVLCAGCFFSLVLAIVTLPTLILLLVIAWTGVSQHTMVPELCGRPWVKNECDLNGWCYLFWQYNGPILCVLTFIQWMRVYGRAVDDPSDGSAASGGSRAAQRRSVVRSLCKPEGACVNIARAIISLPILVAIGFYLVYWPLVSPNVFWQRNDLTKANILSHIPRQYQLGDEVIWDPALVRNISDDRFPLFFKPNICSRSSDGASPIENVDQAERYMAHRARKRYEDSTLVQDFDTDGNEAVIMYVKLPYWEQGIIKTIWIKRSRRSMNVHLNARRDIVNEIKALNKKLPAPQKLPQPKDWDIWVREGVKVLIRDDIAQSPPLVSLINEIADGIPGCFLARFDIKYESEEQLAQGQGFKILEVDVAPYGDRREKNDQSDEDPDYYRGFPNTARRVRTMAMQIYAGAVNVCMGYALGPVELLFELPRLIERSMRCHYTGSMAPATPGLV